MHCQATSSAFDTPSLAAFPSKVRERRMIVATLADGGTRELSVQIEVDPERPFDVPKAIAGQFCEAPATSVIVEMKDQPVAVDGRRYRFTKIDKNGSFRLRKGW